MIIVIKGNVSAVYLNYMVIVTVLYVFIFPFSSVTTSNICVIPSKLISMKFVVERSTPKCIRRI